MLRFSPDNSPEARERRGAINPWVRAECGVPDDVTRLLIPEEYRDHYDSIMAELGAASVAKIEADERYRLASTSHHEFFGGLLGGNAA